MTHDTMSPRDLALYAIVRRRPGIHFRGLGRAANMRSMGQLRHHVDKLVGQGMLVELSDGGYCRYLVQGDQEASIRPLLVRLSRSMRLRLARLLVRGPMTRTDLRRALGCADSTAGYHLNDMVANQDVAKERVGNRCYYSLVDSPLVLDALAFIDGRARPSHVGETVAALAATATFPAIHVRQPGTVPSFDLEVRAVSGSASSSGAQEEGPGTESRHDA